MARRAVVLLVTGFGPFPGARSNPTQRIVRALGGAFAQRMARLGVRLERRILPVTWAGTPAALRDLEAELAPDAILHLGLAARRRTVTVERRAHNRNRPLSQDANGRRASARIVDAGAPATRAATVSIHSLVADLSRIAPTAPSNDAGAYLCNLALWTSLALGRARPVVFVHIPRPANPRGRRAAARPTMAALIRMAEQACLALAIQARRLRAVTPR
ncbi:MAG: hypothetical protein IPL88_15340 [Rhizobiales bacterium]|nr:hypothetical protein [Hyphomicrobiales bacterium]